MIVNPLARRGVPYGLRKRAETTYDEIDKRVFENDVRAKRLAAKEVWLKANIIKDMNNRNVDGLQLTLGVSYAGSDGSPAVIQVWELDSTSSDPYKVSFAGQSCRLDRPSYARGRVRDFLHIPEKALAIELRQLQETNGSS